MMRVKELYFYPAKGESPVRVQALRLIGGVGIDGDYHSGGESQISLWGAKSMSDTLALDKRGLCMPKFSANVLLDGLEGAAIKPGMGVRLGEAAVSITRAGKPCYPQQCALPAQGIDCPLQTCLYGTIERGGMLSVGDSAFVQAPNSIRVAIIIASDKGFCAEREDACGPLLKELLLPHAAVLGVWVLPDDREEISAKLIRLTEDEAPDIILTSGGTGFAPRDVTPEATMDVVERCAPGIPEAMRAHSMGITDRAMLSRATAGIRGKTLIINLPGSPKAVRECMDVFLPVMAHAVETLRGDSYECAGARI